MPSRFSIVTDKDIQIKIPNEKIIDYVILAPAFPQCPFLIFTEKSTYAFIVNEGIIRSIRERISGNNTLYKLFDFTLTHPIYQNSYAIINANFPNGLSEKVNREMLLVLAFRILSDLASIHRIYNFLSVQYKVLKVEIISHIDKYSGSNAELLPQIPLLKENIDAFFNCATNLISNYITFFDIKYMKGTIDKKNPSMYKCIKFLKENDLDDKDMLLQIFNSIKDTEAHIRTIRNCLYHPENYLLNTFLYNIHFDSDNQITYPILEVFENENNEPQYLNLIEYIGDFLEIFLSFSKKYLSFMANH